MAGWKKSYIFHLIMLMNTVSVAQPIFKMETFQNPPIIDGIIDSLEWYTEAKSIELIQLEQDRGQVATRQTDFYAGQIRDDLYFAFVCHVNSPNEISSRIVRRDQVRDSDDLVALVLDTYNDGRTSLLFLVNPLGTLADAKINDDGKSLDFNWDTQWEGEVEIHKDSWVVEIKINLRDIQFSPRATVWTANFGRVIRENMETAWWSEVTENYRVSQGGKLTGVDPAKKNNSNLILFPYGTIRYEDSDISEIHNEFKGAAGMDLRCNIGANLSVNLTYNPDFATVEGDKEIINLTPWELRFPDKRLFFQDGNELFNTRISTFYSRRIGDMNWGGKIIGKAGKYQFNGLFAKTKENKLENDPPAMQNAIRIKRDILNASVIGLTYADKISDSTYYRSLSLDYILNLGKTWKLTGQFVGSGPGDFASHSAWFVRFARENNIYHYHIRYSNIGKNFQDNVNKTGFIPDDDRHELDGDLKYKWWINKTVSYLSFVGKNNVFWSQEGILRSWYLTYTGRIYLKNRFSFDIEYNDEYKLLEKDFYNHFYKAELGYNTDEATLGKLSYTKGQNFGNDFYLWSAEAKIRILNKLNFTYELNILNFEPDPEQESAVINVLGADYFFHKDLWIRIFTQNNSQNNKFYFYGLFGWRFKPPFGAAYLIYSSDKYDEYLPTNKEITQSKLLFLKLTYPIQFF